MSIRLILVDDHPVLLDGLEQLLRLEPDFEIVARCRTTAEALRAIRAKPPDVVILDVKLQNENGLNLLDALAGRSRPAVIVLTASEDEDELLDAVRRGARGVVLKVMASTALERCIRAVHGGGRWLMLDGIDLEKRLAHRGRIENRLAEQLTPRELEVFRELATDRDNETIARRLDLAGGTVRLHIHHVYQKLGVGSRHELWRFLKRRKY